MKKGFIKYAPNKAVNVKNILVVCQMPDKRIGFKLKDNDIVFVDGCWEDEWRSAFDLFDQPEEEKHD